jgi:hypothetical protein
MTNEDAGETPPPAAQLSNILAGRMPDITAAQIVAVIGAVITAAVAFGADISREQQVAILSIAGVVAAILVGSDAHLRSRRSHAEAIKHLADRHLEATKASVEAGFAPPAPPIIPPRA